VVTPDTLSRVDERYKHYRLYRKASDTDDDELYAATDNLVCLVPVRAFLIRSIRTSSSDSVPCAMFAQTSFRAHIVTFKKDHSALIDESDDDTSSGGSRVSEEVEQLVDSSSR
jgi:hypothetical protein